MIRSVLPDLARAPALVAERGLTLGRPMHLLATTSSTNDEAKRAAAEGAPHGSTWVAEAQTAGRGRQGRSWLATPGESILASVLVRAKCPPARLPLIALVAGLAVRDAVARAATGARVAIKWPNDVLVEGRKVAGILVEAITIGARVDAVVVGMGINVHSRAFPQDLASRATSVALVRDAGGDATDDVSSHPPDRADLLADAIGGLDRDLHVVVDRGLGLFRARLASADALRGLVVQSDIGDAHDAHERGVASGIDDEGRLMVRREDGSIGRWAAGEVHVVPVSHSLSQGKVQV
jgi:BirA family transcriptional regulator, biotin operon repressor / biotin---[acetyl-CoA-carboxylase] ligase